MFISPRSDHSTTGSRPGCLAVVLGLMLLAASTAGAQQVRLHASQDSVSVGERFHLSLVIEHDRGRTIHLPGIAPGQTEFGDLLVLSVSRMSSRPLTASAVVDSIVYEVATFALDSAIVPAMPLHLVSAEDTLTVSSPTLRVPVRSHVPPDAETIRDMAPLAEIPSRGWPWLLILLGAALAALGLAYYLRRRGKGETEAAIAATALSPYEAALQQLDMLQEMAISRQEEVKAFYVSLTDCLRIYLSESLPVHALESTTRELISSLQKLESIPAEIPDRCRTVLEQADLVKFADQPATQAACRHSLDETRVIIHAIESSLRARAAEEETVSSTGVA